MKPPINYTNIESPPIQAVDRVTKCSTSRNHHHHHDDHQPTRLVSVRSLAIVLLLAALLPQHVFADAKPAAAKHEPEPVGTLEAKPEDSKSLNEEQQSSENYNQELDDIYREYLNNQKYEDHPDSEEPTDVEFDLERPSEDESYERQQQWPDYEPQVEQDESYPEEEEYYNEQYEPEQEEQSSASDQEEQQREFEIEPLDEQSPEEEAPVEEKQPINEAQKPTVAPVVKKSKAEIKKKSVRLARQGEAEFIGFYDPEISPSHAMVSKPEVSVKRAIQIDMDGEQKLAFGNFVYLAVITVCSCLAIVGVIVAGVFYYKVQSQRETSEAEYPQFGVIGSGKSAAGRAGGKQTSRGDQRMAYSAQLHHYQQTKQKIISMEQSGMDGQRERESDASEDEGDEGDYSVYECPGLAPTGDIEVSNPMFENSKSGATTPNEPKAKGEH